MLREKEDDGPCLYPHQPFVPLKHVRIRLTSEHAFDRDQNVSNVIKHRTNSLQVPEPGRLPDSLDGHSRCIAL